MSNWDDFMNNWNDPAEEEKKREKALKEEHDARFLKETCFDSNWGYNDSKKPWFFERERLYKILGFKEVDKQVLNYKVGTGQYEFKQTSSSTYEHVEKKERHTSITYYLEVDTHKISDINRYKEIKKNIDTFLSESEKKFGSGRKLGDAIVPAYFRLEEVYTMLCQDDYNKLSRLEKGLNYPYYQAKAKKFHEDYTTKNADYKPLVDAYFEQVKAFEEEIKQIANFD